MLSNKPQFIIDWLTQKLEFITIIAHLVERVGTFTVGVFMPAGQFDLFNDWVAYDWTKLIKVVFQVEFYLLVSPTSNGVAFSAWYIES